MEETAGVPQAPRPIAADSATVERSKRKNQAKIQKEQLEIAAKKTEDIAQTIAQQRSHYQHDPVSPGKEEDSPEVQAFRAKIAEELGSPEQVKIAADASAVANRRFGGG